MSSRSRSRRSTGQPPAKRRRTMEIGEPGTDDDIPTPQAQANAPSASALSVRVLPPEHLPTLATLCIRAFVHNLKQLSRDQNTWEDMQLWLKELPAMLTERVTTGLRNVNPTLLSHGFITTYLLRGSAVVLSEELPAVGRQTILAIGDMPTKNIVSVLELTGFSKITDPTFASVVSKLPSLRKLNLRGCTKVSKKTIESAAKHCPHLEIVNISYTTVPAVSLAPLLVQCKQLEVLKAAGIPNWTDSAFFKLWNAVSDLSAVVNGNRNAEFPHLRSLKLRQAPLNNIFIESFLNRSPNLERLDVSFTHVCMRFDLSGSKRLVKLALTSTQVYGPTIVAAVASLPHLRSLAIGALGGGQGSTVAIANTSAMTMTDETLRALTDALLNRDAGASDGDNTVDVGFEHINLVGNTKLGLTGRRGPDAALAYFIRKVGRRCKRLNLAGITSLQSSDLEGLANPDDGNEGPPLLTHLNLNNTSVDDTAAPYLSACVHLQTLELAGTKFSNAGLFPVIDACERLEKLDLTSCRGVRVGERRRFFEVWEKEWKNT